MLPTRQRAAACARLQLFFAGVIIKLYGGMRASFAVPIFAVLLRRKEMTLDEECKGCLYNSQMKKVERSHSDPEKLEEFRSRVRKLCANPPAHYCAPLLMRDIDSAHREIFGGGIDYSAEKKMFNSAVLAMEDDLYAHITGSSDPLAEAIKYAAAANYIDFAKLSDLNADSISVVRQAAEKTEPDAGVLALLKSRLASAKTILYVHDNCGEVVFDKILIRVIRLLYPELRVTSLVRGGEIINDATRIDAEYIGLDKYADVEDSGEAIPGTYLKELSPRALELFNSHDVIISKGLGNLETLYGEGYDIFYIFMCKCEHIARRFSLPQWSTAFVHEGK